MPRNGRASRPTPRSPAIWPRNATRLGPGRLQDHARQPGRRLRRARPEPARLAPRLGRAPGRMAVPGPAAAQGRPSADRRLGADPDRGRKRLSGIASARSTLSASASTCFTTLLGMAKPMPTLPALLSLLLGLNNAELMPISSPCRLIRAPPELPGLIGASVWMKRRESPCPSGRSVALMMPLVTVWPRPNGLPIATT